MTIGYSSPYKISDHFDGKRFFNPTARGVEPKGRDVPIGLAWGLSAVMEGMWRTLRLRSQPLLTRQMVRMVGYDFTLSDQRARAELGYSPVVSWDEGDQSHADGATRLRFPS